MPDTTARRCAGSRLAAIAAPNAGPWECAALIGPGTDRPDVYFVRIVRPDLRATAEAAGTWHGLTIHGECCWICAHDLTHDLDEHGNGAPSHWATAELVEGTA